MATVRTVLRDCDYENENDKGKDKNNVGDDRTGMIPSIAGWIGSQTGQIHPGRIPR